MNHRNLALWILLWLLLAGLLAPVAVAQTEDRPATIQDFAWLSGHWVGGEEGELIEETWGAPHNGLILGMFRQDSPQQTFYELFTLSEIEDGAMELRISHFNVGLEPWEERGLVRFAVQSWQPNRVVFVDEEGARLIYERDGDNLEGALEKDRDGETRRFEFRFRRAPL